MNLRTTPRQLGLGAIVAASLVLISLTWLGTLHAVRSHRTEAEARLEANVASQVALFAQQVRMSLLEVDEELRTLTHAWESDPEHFRLLSWRNQLVLLNEISPDLILVDKRGRIVDGTTSELVGSDVSDTDYFRALAKRRADDASLFVGPSTIDRVLPEWHMSFARPLRYRDGSFAGVIVAMLRASTLSRIYNVGNIEANDLVAIVGMEQGVLRFVMGPTAAGPGSSIADSEMFKAMRASPDSVWIGRMVPGEIERVHGFRLIAGYNLGVVAA